MPGTGHANPPPPLELLEYATESQAAKIRAVHKYGSAKHAAKALKITARAVNYAIEGAKNRAALRGAGLPEPTPEGFSVKGTTTLYDADGAKKLQWVKTDRDRETQMKAMQAAMDSVAEKYTKGIPVPEAPPKTDLSHLCALYPLGDMHIGLYTAASEVGADWNLEIAEKH